MQYGVAVASPSQTDPVDDESGQDALVPSSVLDAVLAELLSPSLDQTPPDRMKAGSDRERDMSNALPADTVTVGQSEWDRFFGHIGIATETDFPQLNLAEPHASAEMAPALQTPSEPARQSAPEPVPDSAYSANDLVLYERLTGYRLVEQRQLWRSVDWGGNRSSASDRLFTVLAEEAFQMASAKRRHGPSPHTDLTIEDIAGAVKQMRSITAHLSVRGNQASDRLEAVVLAALDERVAA